EIEGLVSVLGGGYGSGMVKSFRSYIEGLLNTADEPITSSTSPGKSIENGVEKVFSLLSKTVQNLKSSLK
ncbi:MAG: hypothetical protein QXQ35_08460, partial [Candidatus Nezhaarchaeales archaeon]